MYMIYVNSFLQLNPHISVVSLSGNKIWFHEKPVYRYLPDLLLILSIRSLANKASEEEATPTELARNV